jgi:hypothetical protein
LRFSRINFLFYGAFLLEKMRIWWKIY